MLVVNDIRRILKDSKPCENGTIEIINASFIADEASIFGEITEYTERELEWYKSMSLNVNDIPGKAPKIWQDVSDENGYINSNYGWCVFSKENYNQFANSIMALIKDKYSRQACMIYTRPTMHIDSKANGMHDFMCTNTVQLLIRNNELHYIVNMRSNDAVYGYKNDKFWHDFVFNEAIKLLNEKTDYNVVKGNMYWNTASLHVYSRHFDLVEKYNG